MLLGMTTEGFGTGLPHPNPARLFFSILKLVLFKKIKPGKDEEILKPASFIFYFVLFLIFFLNLLFYFYYIKINIFHKKIKIL